VRGIRPLHLARLLVLSVPLGVIAPWAALPAAAQAKPAPAKATQTPAYSAKAAEERKARLARARAAAAAREQARLRAERALREAMTPRYKTDEATGTLVPDIRAAAAIIFDPVTGQVLWEENAQDKRSIASITKVMTAVVLLENDPDLSRRVVIDRSDVLAASVTYLRAGDRITLDHLLHLTLIASDNGAARALARTSPGGSKAFIQRMNEKAIDLGLDSTSFADPSGLNPDNISSAYDLSRLIVFASHDERIAAIMRRVTFTARTHNRSFEIRNTNHRSAAARSTSSAARPASSARRVTAWPRCFSCRRASTRSRSSCSGPVRTTAGSGKRVTSSTGSPTGRPRCSPARPRRTSRPRRRPRVGLHAAGRSIGGVVLYGA
jgi:serine-type D-Ala-D-Ala endopeptidase (penicillin-binding protein 7)